jgi:hypothetical protein
VNQCPGSLAHQRDFDKRVSIGFQLAIFGKQAIDDVSEQATVSRGAVELWRYPKEQNVGLEFG